MHDIDAPPLPRAAAAAGRATVAVSPFIGQTGESLAMAAARLARVAGVALTLPRAVFVARLEAGEIIEADLAEALAESAEPAKPESLTALRDAFAAALPAPQALPSVAELAARATVTDWPGVIARTIGLWAAGHFDRGQALWTQAPGHSAYAGWREWAMHDLTPD